MASLMGPTESQFARKQKSGWAKTEVIIKPGNYSIKGIEQLTYTVQELAASLIQIDQYPKCLIQIILRVVELNGSLLSAACNALTCVIHRSGLLMQQSGRCTLKCSVDKSGGV